MGNGKNTDTADTIRKRKTYRTHGTAHGREECVNVRYIVYISKKSESKVKRGMCLGLTGEECEIEIRNQGNANQKRKRTTGINPRTITQ